MGASAMQHQQLLIFFALLIGAIGGAITRGIIGLFERAVILALGYELFRAWLETPESA